MKAERFDVTLENSISGIIESYGEVDSPNGKWKNYEITLSNNGGIYALGWMAKTGVDRQFERLSMSIDEAMEQQVPLTFYRTPNKDDASKSWLNIKLADSTPAPKAAPPSITKKVEVPPRKPTGKQPISLGAALPGEEEETQETDAYDTYMAMARRLLEDPLTTEMIEKGVVVNFDLNAVAYSILGMKR